MTDAQRVFKAGTRSSTLALVQTRNALRRLEAHLPGCRFEDVPVSSPGDRDLKTDLRESPADFFTRDLDDMLRAGQIDCAVHSAKDLPDPLPPDIDWFWLPWREDPRDVVICRAGERVDALPDTFTIGVSSDRRESYCAQRFPAATQRTIRGTIEERMAQLDQGDFDMIIMASAALLRLDLADRITEWIPLEDLPSPAGQGFLALTFRAGDERLMKIRALFVKSVTFAAAGIGTAGTCTLDGLKALRRCDVCLHDALMGPDLLDLVPPHVELIHVGKRCGRHSLPQPEITKLIETHACRGRRVVRLKGGDPGVFGRLAEEVEALDARRIPYRALPGVSSLSAASTGTGMLLTRRGLSRGFCVMTPRTQGGGKGPVTAAERSKLPLVLYMSVSVTDQVARELIDDGWSPTTPAAVVFGAGGDQSHILSGTLATIGALVAQTPREMPGLLMIGDVTGYRYHPEWGALQDDRILLTCSRALQDKAAGLVHDYGGRPVCRPLIDLVTTPDALERVRQIESYDWVILTSPSAVRCFGDVIDKAGIDLRRLPKLVTCGGGTSAAFAEMRLTVDIEPTEHFGAESLIATLRPLAAAGPRVLRLRSDKAGPALAEALREEGAIVDDCVLYHNQPIAYADTPSFDTVFFASASAVEVFDSQWGVDALSGKTIVAIGKPTVSALAQRGISVDLVPPEATVESSIAAMAAQHVSHSMAQEKETNP